MIKKLWFNPHLGQFYILLFSVNAGRILAWIWQKTVADLGFPRGGGANPQSGGRQPIIWSIISRKLHENERIWTQRGARPWRPPLDPPMENNKLYKNSISCTVNCGQLQCNMVVHVRIFIIITYPPDKFTLFRYFFKLFHSLGNKLWS